MLCLNKTLDLLYDKFEPAPERISKRLGFPNIDILEISDTFTSHTEFVDVFGTTFVTQTHFVYFLRENILSRE